MNFTGIQFDKLNRICNDNFFCCAVCFKNTVIGMIFYWI
jgi:hypothetical protein